jgi:hypothetical protein
LPIFALISIFSRAQLLAGAMGGKFMDKYVKLLIDKRKPAGCSENAQNGAGN